MRFFKTILLSSCFMVLKTTSASNEISNSEGSESRAMSTHKSLITELRNAPIIDDELMEVSKKVHLFEKIVSTRIDDLSDRWRDKQILSDLKEMVSQSPERQKTSDVQATNVQHAMTMERLLALQTVVYKLEKVKNNTDSKLPFSEKTLQLLKEKGQTYLDVQTEEKKERNTLLINAYTDLNNISVALDKGTNDLNESQDNFERWVGAYSAELPRLNDEYGELVELINSKIKPFMSDLKGYSGELTSKIESLSKDN